MASNGVGSVGGGVSGIFGPRGVRDDVSSFAGRSASARGAREDGAQERRYFINVDGIELNTRAARGTYLDILV